MWPWRSVHVQCPTRWLHQTVHGGVVVELTTWEGRRSRYCSGIQFVVSINERWQAKPGSQQVVGKIGAPLGLESGHAAWLGCYHITSFKVSQLNSLQDTLQKDWTNMLCSCSTLFIFLSFKQGKVESLKTSSNSPQLDEIINMRICLDYIEYNYQVSFVVVTRMGVRKEVVVL